MSFSDAFSRIAGVLDKAKIDSMVVGSFACSYYGAMRSTQDIDIVIRANDEKLKSLQHLLPPSEYYFDLDMALEARRHESMFNVVDLNTGWKIDLIVAKSRAYSQEEFRRRVAVTLAGVSTFVATIEDLIISKIEWAKFSQSNRQIQDVVALLKMFSQSIDRAYIEKWAAALGIQSEWERVSSE